MATRSRTDRIEFRTTADTRRLLEEACEASGSNLTQFAEQSLIASARRVLADRNQFTLDRDALDAWESVNEAPARDLPSLRELFDRPSPFR
jgi:uncharacterized protein (DUF1778 family)